MAEELKLQLGDRMPAVLQVAAKSMNMTTAEFLKAMEAGRVSAEEFLPVFTKALREMAAPGLDKAFRTMNVSWKRMVQNGKLLIKAVFESGVGELFTQIFNSLSDIFRVMQPIFSLLFSFAATFAKILIFPIRLVAAILRDLTVMFDNWIQDTWGTDLNSIMATMGKWAAYIGSIFGGIAKTVGWIVKGVSKIFGFTGTARVGRETFKNLPPKAQKTIADYTKAGVAGARAAAQIGGAVTRSIYTKAGAVGMGAQETGQYIYTNTTLELSGTAADALRENTRQSTTTAVPSNNRG